MPSADYRDEMSPRQPLRHDPVVTDRLNTFFGIRTATTSPAEERCSTARLLGLTMSLLALVVLVGVLAFF